jgi:hypothetical protein
LAIKIFCDVCNETITPNEESGQLVYAEKTFQLFKGKQEPAIKKTEMVFCEKCIRGLRSYIHNQRGAQRENAKG